MNIKEYKDILPKLFKANIVPHLWGAHGIGKTEIHRQLAESLGLNLVYLTFGAVEDVGDIIGLQDFIEVDGVKKTQHTAPDWFPTKPGNLIFIDEFNRANSAILQAMFPFILEGRLHTHKLPNNSFIVLASNPPTDEYLVNDIGDSALMSRCCHFELKPTVQEFLTYMRQQDASPAVVNFITNRPEMLEVEKDGFDFGTLKPNRRGVHKVADFNKLSGPTQNQLSYVATGLCGVEFAASFIKSLSDFETAVSGRHVYDNGLNGVNRTKLKNLIKDSRIDSLNCTVEDILFILKEDDKADDKNLKHVSEFVKMLPKGLAFRAVRDILTLNSGNTQVIIGEDLKIKEMFEKESIKETKANKKGGE